jgi:hypothetical protein
MLHEGPGTQPAMQLRVARHTERLQEVVEFYRDGIGLTQIGGFRDHDGYDGVFLAVPRPLESRSLRLASDVEVAVDGCPADPQRRGDRRYGVLPGAVHLPGHPELMTGHH